MKEQKQPKASEAMQGGETILPARVLFSWRRTSYAQEICMKPARWFSMPRGLQEVSTASLALRWKVLTSVYW